MYGWSMVCLNLKNNKQTRVALVKRPQSLEHHVLPFKYKYQLCQKKNEVSHHHDDDYDHLKDVGDDGCDDGDDDDDSI